MRPGIFRFGYVSTSVQSPQYNCLDLKGTIIIHGDVAFGSGSSIEVHKNAILDIGDWVWCNNQTKIFCHSKIVIGPKFLSGWEVQIFDTDMHYLIVNGRIHQNSNPINIGEGVWVGNRTTIAKGTIIPKNSVVTSYSLTNKDFTTFGENLLIGGIPARLIKDSTKCVMWRGQGPATLLEPQIDDYFIHNDIESIDANESWLANYIL